MQVPLYQMNSLFPSQGHDAEYEAFSTNSGFFCVGDPDTTIDDARRNSLVSSQNSASLTDCSTVSTGFSETLSGGPHTPINGSFGWDVGPSPDSSMSDSQTSTVFSSAYPMLTPDATPQTSRSEDCPHWSDSVVSQFDSFKPPPLDFDYVSHTTNPHFYKTLTGAAARVPSNMQPELSQSGCPLSPPIELVNEAASTFDYTGKTRNSSTRDGRRDKRASHDLPPRHRLKCDTRITKSGARGRSSRHQRKGQINDSTDFVASDICFNKVKTSWAPRAFEKCPHCGEKFAGAVHLKRHRSTASSCKFKESKDPKDANTEVGEFDCPVARCLGTKFCQKLIGHEKPISRHDNITQHMATHVVNGTGTPRNAIVKIQVIEACISKEAENEEEASRQKESVRRAMDGKATHVRSLPGGKDVMVLSDNAHISHDIMERLGFDCSDGCPWTDLEDLEGNVIGRGPACEMWVPPKWLPKGEKVLEVDGECTRDGRPLQLAPSKVEHGISLPVY